MALAQAYVHPAARSLDGPQGLRWQRAMLALRADEIALSTAGGQLVLLVLLLATTRATSQQLACGLLLRHQVDRLVAENDEVNALIVDAFLSGLGVRCERVSG